MTVLKSVLFKMDPSFSAKQRDCLRATSVKGQN